MTHVNISATNIGSSVVAENAHIGTISGSVQISEGGAEEKLIAMIQEQLNLLAESKHSLSAEQLKSLAGELTGALAELRSKEDVENKKGIITDALKKIMDTIGIAGNVLQTFLKLSALIGVS